MTRRVSTLDLVPQPAQTPAAPREITGRAVAVNGATVHVDFGEGVAVPLPAQPGGYVAGTPVRVLVDEQRRPVSVLRPVRDAREGEHVDVVMPGVVGSSVLGDLSPEDAARLAAAEQAIRDARDEMGELDSALGELDGHLDSLTRSLPIFSRWMPTTSHPQGTIWYQLNASSQIEGVWEQTTAPEGRDWQGRPLTSTAVVSLTAAQITAGTGSFQTAVAQKIWAEVITAARVSANRGVFRDLVAEHVSVVSSSGGRGVRITDAGLILTGEDGSAAVDLTTAASTYLSILSGGRRVAGIESDGTVSGVVGSFARDVVVAGQSVRDALTSAGGSALGKAQLQSTRAVAGNVTQGVIETAFTVPQSGHRQVQIRGRVELGESAGGWAVVGFHLSTDAYATTANTRRHQETLPVYIDRRGGGSIEWELSTAELVGVSPGQTVRVLMSLETTSTGVSVIAGTGTWLSIRDLGPAQPTRFTVMEPGAPITRAPERTTSEKWVPVSASGFQSYRADGSPISKTGSDIGARFAVQGNSGAGMKWSLIEFSYAEQVAAVQGATVLGVRVHINGVHWWANAGGVASVGVYGPIPASLPSSQIGAWGLKSVHIPRGGWGTVQFDANVNAGFQSLQTRSISLFTTNNNPSAYGYIDPSNAVLEILRRR